MIHKVGFVSDTNRMIIAHDRTSGKLMYVIRCQKCESVITGGKSAVYARCGRCGRRNADIDAVIKKMVYSKYRLNAKYRSIGFNIDEEDFYSLLSKDCVYCGKAPENKWVAHGYANEREETPFLIYQGVDRLYNDMPYSKENAAPCCKECNFLKRDYNVDDFEKLLDLIYSRKEIWKKEQANAKRLRQ